MWLSGGAHDLLICDSELNPQHRGKKQKDYLPFRLPSGQCWLCDNIMTNELPD